MQKSLSIPVLDPHQIIGVDFDGTLIGGRNGDLLYRYIVEHHKSKTFWIVTFRSGGFEDHCFGELEFTFENDPPPQTMFAGIESVPHQIWFQAQMDTAKRKNGFLTGPMTTAEKQYCEWKGAACKRRGCTILIDDLPNCVLPGTMKHGIDFVPEWELTSKRIPARLPG